jgi:pyrroloquinoline quinone (PQQ) biosynthesis protein C
MVAQADVRSPDAFIAELEGLRAAWRQTHPFRIREITSPDELPRLGEGKRRRHAGGDDNHRFEGERYLNCTDKASRRMQLRKLVDEGGQTTVGGPQVSHPLLSRWESYAYGLTPDEITALEKGDSDPAELVRRGWWLGMNRDSHFAVAIGSGLVLEGEHKLRSAELLAAIAEDHKRFEAWGVPNVDQALENRREHAGVDVDHADFNEAVVRQFVTTPELQDEMRRVFILRLQMFSGA